MLYNYIVPGMGFRTTIPTCPEIYAYWFQYAVLNAAHAK